MCVLIRVLRAKTQFTILCKKITIPSDVALCLVNHDTKRCTCTFNLSVFVDVWGMPMSLLTRILRHKTTDQNSSVWNHFLCSCSLCLRFAPRNATRNNVYPTILESWVFNFVGMPRAICTLCVVDILKVVVCCSICTAKHPSKTSEPCKPLEAVDKNKPSENAKQRFSVRLSTKTSLLRMQNLAFARGCRQKNKTF